MIKLTAIVESKYGSTAFPMQNIDMQIAEKIDETVESVDDCGSSTKKLVSDAENTKSVKMRGQMVELKGHNSEKFDGGY